MSGIEKNKSTNRKMNNRASRCIDDEFSSDENNFSSDEYFSVGTSTCNNISNCTIRHL